MPRYHKMQMYDVYFLICSASQLLEVLKVEPATLRSMADELARSRESGMPSRQGTFPAGLMNTLPVGQLRQHSSWNLGSACPTYYHKAYVPSSRLLVIEGPFRVSTAYRSAQN